MGDAGVDVFCLDEVLIPAGSVKRVALGNFNMGRLEPLCILSCPPNKFATFFNRSSNVTEFVILNTVVDSGFRGNLFAFVQNDATHHLILEKNRKIAQMVFLNFELPNNVIKGIVNRELKCLGSTDLPGSRSEEEDDADDYMVL